MATHLLIRHGETPYNANPEFVGGRSNHLPLTERGKRQALAFGKYIGPRASDITAVYHSGAVRAQHTCELALDAAVIHIEPFVEPLLQELSQGNAEGRPRIEIYTPEFCAYLDAAGLDGHHANGESLRDAQERMHNVLTRAEACHDGVVLYFTHGLAIRALVGRIQDYAKPEILSLSTDNLSVTRIDAVNDEFQVVEVGKNVIPEYT